MRAFGILVAVLGASVVVFLFAQLRARRIRERYVWLWLLLLIGIGAVAVIPGLANTLATFFGFQLVSNLILSAAAIVTFLITVSLSAEVSRLQLSIRTLTEEVAFLRAELTALRAPSDKPEPPDDAESTIGE